MKIGNIFISKMSSRTKSLKSKSKISKIHQSSKAETIQIARQLFEQSPRNKLNYDETDLFEIPNTSPILNLLKKHFQNT
jgi:hypothetical protein